MGQLRKCDNQLDRNAQREDDLPDRNCKSTAKAIRELLRETFMIHLGNWREFKTFFKQASKFLKRRKKEREIGKKKEMKENDEKLEILNGDDPEGEVKGSNGKLKYSWYFPRAGCTKVFHS